MAQTPSGMDEILGRWRNIVKDKKRQIITPEEAIEAKVKSLKPWIYVDQEPVDGWEFRQFRYTRKRERRFIDEAWRPIRVGETWGGPDISAFFRTKATMPARYKGKKVVLQVYFSGDGLLSVNGAPYHGLDPFRNTVPLTDCATGAETYDLECESYIFWHAGETEVKNFECSHFAVFDQEMSDIYWDLQCALKVMLTEEIEAPARNFVQGVLAEAVASIDHFERDPETIRANARKAGAVVRRGLYESELFQKTGLMHLNGNSHLDVCFMWTHAEFIRKIGRTHATQLRLIEQFPDFVFSQSQPLMYEEMKRHYPKIFEQVQQRIKEGRWEAIGAFYVEPDANLISGESFVRQLLHGVRFMEREFGVTPRTAWIPDVFGNTWSMPQILVRAGLRYFVTHKMILWNDTNKWKHNVFWWQGPDGSRVFATVPPSGFIGTMEPDHMTEHWNRNAAKQTVGESLYNFGWGDGGGGPDIEMLESIKRYKRFPGMVPTRVSSNEDALESMRQKALAAGDDISVVNDELYLEEHRGTYTTKAIFKKLNRYCEFLYRKAELYSCFSNLPYPSQALEEGWKTILLNQFHDSLPGSHVTVVHEDLIESYEQPLRAGEDIVGAALEEIADRIDTRGEGAALLVFNAQPFERDAMVCLAANGSDVHFTDADGVEIPHQSIVHFESGQPLVALRVKGLPPVGYKVFRGIPGKGKSTASNVAVSPTSLENEFIRLRLNAAGEIISLFDKTTQRECIDHERRGNVFRLYEDEPGRHEAWDIVSTFRSRSYDMGAATTRVLEEGPVRSAIEVTREFQSSKIVQRIVLAAGSRRVDFETYIDWHEQHKLLKAEFNTTLLSRHATYDIAFANIERATTRNNSYEEARFEVPAHLWMDLSQGDHGLSLLNDCKYGHEAWGQMMALTLLKGSTYPDPVADQGEHWFTYSLLPHGKTWREAQTMREALDLNDPVDVSFAESHAGALPPVHSFLRIEGEGVTLEAVKKAEDSDDIVVRVVERHGGEADVRIGLDRLSEVSECNLLEREDVPAAHDGDDVKLRIRPYEIRTLKLRRKES